MTAIVAADVVNYSILMGQNELGTLSKLSILQQEVITPAVTKYKGRVIRLMGDGSLLAFNSALDAMEFAVDVQRIMAERKTASPLDIQIDFRMGVNLGDVILTENDFHGEGINVAVRLEEIAPPGGICISHSIHMQTKNALGEELLPIGERQLKNIAEPVLVWRWQPPGAAGIVQRKAQPPVHGRQILDPKVTSLLMDLYMKAAKLSVSEGFDELLASPDTGRDLPLEAIYGHFSRKLNEARALMFPISVECGAGESGQTPRFWAPSQSMSDFIAHAFDSGDIFLAVNMLVKIRAVLQSDQSTCAKRAELQRLIRHVLHESRVPQIKSRIKFAFVEP
ncbi:MULTISPECIES: adenylate/guanylate cyclase domain-containing protein [Rhodomicrobium]|uniref:adenylate/guanylate cyclase domain-containing protein n=1 Tax=Rhodomicrobium TaxID=1068 RepID=UPI000F749890|nr:MULTISPECIES: adenylate/guanylate cyclase domain-containing protein [Rhodomicrobium]